MKYKMKCILEMIIHLTAWVLFFTITSLTEKVFEILGVYYLIVMAIPSILGSFAKSYKVSFTTITYTYAISSIFIAPIIISLSLGINFTPLFVIGFTLGITSLALSRTVMHQLMKKTIDCKNEKENCDCEH
jgi:hypothetical protein